MGEGLRFENEWNETSSKMLGVEEEWRLNSWLDLDYNLKLHLYMTELD